MSFGNGFNNKRGFKRYTGPNILKDNLTFSIYVLNTM